MRSAFRAPGDFAGFTLAPGARARALFGERAMVNLVEMEPDAEVAMHSHPHEQLGVILRGSMTMTIGGEVGQVGELGGYVIAPDVEHGGRAGPAGALVLDVFAPVREDYRTASGEA